MTEISLAINQLKGEMGGMLASIQKSIDSRIDMTVKKCVASTSEFAVKAHIDALQKLQASKTPLTNDQLTRRYNDLFTEINIIKQKTSDYHLHNSMSDLMKRFDNLCSELNWVKNTLNQMVSDRYIETGIKPDEINELYSKSQCSPDQVSNFLNTSKENFYLILNGKEKKPDLKRLHVLKQFLLKKIFERSS